MIYLFAKRLFDLLASAVAIVILLPVFAVIWACLRLGSRGPAIFKQERAGKNATPFILFKFRTMRTEADPFGPSPQSGLDPRLTKTGIFLREYSLDELPQLFNVLTGNMSLVGPRPLYIAQIAEWDQRQIKRLLVKPGLTGLAQVSGRGALTREQKLEFDAQYVEKASFFFDLKIILATILQIFSKSDIYEKQYSADEKTRGEGK